MVHYLFFMQFMQMREHAQYEAYGDEVKHTDEDNQLCLIQPAVS